MPKTIEEWKAVRCNWLKGPNKWVPMPKSLESGFLHGDHRGVLYVPMPKSKAERIAKDPYLVVQGEGDKEETC